MQRNKNKIKILVAAVFPPPVFGVPKMMELLSGLKYEDIEFYKFDLRFNKDYDDLEVFKFRKFFTLIKYLIKFRNNVRKNKYDIVIIVHSFRLSAFLKDSLFVFISKYYGSKVILNAHGQEFDENFYNKQKKFFQKWIDKTFEKTDAVITVGKKMMNEYSRWMNIVNTKHLCDYVYNVLPEKIPVIEKTFNDEEFNILFLSTITESKGVFVLLETAQIIKNSGIKDINFILCGKFKNKIKNEEKEILKYIDKFNLSDIIQIKGWVEGEEKENIFKASSIFFFPSLNDSFGLVNLEAMAYGLPIVATKVGAIPEYIINGENGFIFNANDISQASNAILNLFYDRKLSEKISANNINKFHKNFNYEFYKNKWYDILLRILNNN